MTVLRNRIAAVAFLIIAVRAVQASSTLTLSADGLTVFDSANGITWLADADLPASNRFTLPLCTSGALPCVNATGSMNYPSAAAWVAAMNAANYLGHNNWQIPTTPPLDPGCTKTGPNGSSFGYGCTASAFGSLYYNGLALAAPNTAVPIPNNVVGPFTNLQPYLYWSQTSAGTSGNNTFSFDTGWVGANTVTHVMYVLPMIPGKPPGTPTGTGQSLQVNPGGSTVYDPVSNVTWLANANIAAANGFGLPQCQTPSTPAVCVNRDGAMNLASASQFVANMNSGSGYLGQTNWQLPPVDPNCSGFNCVNAANPMGELFYKQFGLTMGMSAVATPNIAVGPMHNIQPYLYWSCLAATIQSACETTQPVANQEFSFSFGNGFEGTDILPNELFATAYFAGSRTSTTGPEIDEVANAEGENPIVAPNTWIEIKGGNFSTSARPWQTSDFLGSQMPSQLDQVSATVNGKSGYVYYISPNQVNVLTPPDAMNGPVQVVVTNNGTATASFTAQAQPLSPSFFIINGGPYVAAQHADYSLLGPASLSAPGYPFAPAKPGEIVLLYANGFGPTSVLVTSGSLSQSGTLSPLPVVTVGGVNATVEFAGLVAPGQFQFNVMIPKVPDGDQPLIATYNGSSTQPGVLITIQK